MHNILIKIIDVKYNFMWSQFFSYLLVVEGVCMYTGFKIIGVISLFVRYVKIDPVKHANQNKLVSLV